MVGRDRRAARTLTVGFAVPATGGRGKLPSDVSAIYWSTVHHVKEVVRLKSFLRSFATLAVAALVTSVVATGAAVASSDSSSSPSGSFTVSVSYPDVVVAGTTATATESVTNTSSATETLTLTNTLAGPAGTTSTQTQVVTLASGERFVQTFSKKVNRNDAGSYTLTFTAAAGTESATATADTTVVEK